MIIDTVSSMRFIFVAVDHIETSDTLPVTHTNCGVDMLSGSAEHGSAQQAWSRGLVRMETCVYLGIVSAAWKLSPVRGK